MCGCKALAHPETSMLKLILQRKGFICEELKYCDNRFDVIGHIYDLQENQVVSLIESIKGVMFNYVLDNDGVKYTVHCEITL